MESVRKLENAELGTLITRLELRNLRYEVDSIDVPALISALRVAQEAYDDELDVLGDIIVLFKTARFRRSQLQVDITVGKQLQDVMDARREKFRAQNLWWRGSQRVEHLNSMINKAEEELLRLKAVEQAAREECYAPMVELARVWTRCRIEGSNDREKNVL